LIGWTCNQLGTYKGAVLHATNHASPMLNRISAILLWLAVTAFVRAAVPAAVDPQSLISPALPAWIRAPMELPPAPAVATSSSIRMLIVEEQMNVATAEQFTHYAMRIESEAGLQNAGQITQTYASTFQKLRWHYLRVWRDGRKREVLSPDAIQVLRQEEDAERFTYHGWLSAVVILHDIRVGDIIEYASTRIGENPVFMGRYSTTLAGAAGVPVDRLLYRIVTPTQRVLHVKKAGAFRPDYHVERGDATEHIWTAADIPAVQPMTDAPDWEIQYPFVQVTEFSSWAEVAAWGRQLFAVPAEPAPELTERVITITKNLTTTEAKANAVVRFVQDEVRYLAIHLGESSHRPSPPDEVLNRRFGDCKDKSLLLVALLRQLGMQADVALVHTGWRGHVAELQPSPLCFDHVIVRVIIPRQRRSDGEFTVTELRQGLVQQSRRELDMQTLSASRAPAIDLRGILPSSMSVGNIERSLPIDRPQFQSDELWIDPTIALQGGAISERNRSDFGYALVLVPDTTALRAVEPVPEAFGGVHVQETYTVTDLGKPADLKIVATYVGASADLHRYYHRSTDPVRGMQQFSGMLSRFYPKIRSRGVIEWTDDRENNVVVGTSHFEVPDFWVTDAQGKKRVASVVPWSISERLPRPDAIERNVSYGLGHPMSVTHEIAIRLPKAWPNLAEANTIKDDTFDFTFDAHGGSVVTAKFTWRTLKDFVPVDRMGAWTKKMSEVRAALGYELSQNIRLAAEVSRQGIVWPLFGMAITGGLVGLLAGIALYRRQPRRLASDEPPIIGGGALQGIGGWLILVALGVTVRPLILGNELTAMVKLIWNRAGWIAMTDPESASFAPGFRSLIFAEAVCGAAFFTWSCVLILQFYSRKASLPASLSTYQISLVAWLMVHLTWLHAAAIPGVVVEPNDFARIVGAVGAAAIWVPYLLRSRRVAYTFTQ
jgi:hypothetical protein